MKRLFLFFLTLLSSIVLTAGCFPLDVGQTTPGITFAQERDSQYFSFPWVDTPVANDDGLWVVDTFGFHPLLLNGHTAATGALVDIPGSPIGIFGYGHHLYLFNQQDSLYIYDTRTDPPHLTQTLSDSNALLWANENYVVTKGYYNSMRCSLYTWQGETLALEGEMELPPASLVLGVGYEDYLYFILQDVDLYNGIFARDLNEGPENGTRGVYFVYLEQLVGMAISGRVVGSNLYVCSRDEKTGNTFFSIYGLTGSPMSPTFVGSVAMGQFNADNRYNTYDPYTVMLSPDERYAFLPSSHGSYHLVDMTDPAQPQASEDLLDANGNTIDGRNAFFTGDAFLTFNEEPNLDIYTWDYSLSDPLILSSTITMPTFYRPNAVTTSGNRMAELFWDQKLLYTYTLESSPQEGMRWDGTIDLTPAIEAAFPGDLALGYYPSNLLIDSGRYLFVLGDTLIVMDDTGAFGFYSMGGRVTWDGVDLLGTKVFLSIQDHGVFIVDVSDVSNPVVIKEIEGPYMFRVHAVDENYCVIGWDDSPGSYYGGMRYDIWNWSAETPFITDTLLDRYAPRLIADRSWLYYDNVIPYTGRSNCAGDAACRPSVYVGDLLSLRPVHITPEGHWEALGSIPYIPPPSYYTYFYFDMYHTVGDQIIANAVLLPGSYALFDLRDRGRPRYADIRNFPGTMWDVFPSPGGFIAMTSEGYTFFDACAENLPETGPFGWLDQPVEGQTVTQGVLDVVGWVIDPLGDSFDTVKVYIDGEFAASVPCGQSRSDVGEAFPDFPLAAVSGFTGQVDLFYLDPGGHRLVVIANDHSVVAIADFTLEEEQ